MSSFIYDPQPESSRKRGGLRSAFRFLSGTVRRLYRPALYIGITYIALFTGVGGVVLTRSQSGCAYYLYRGHCSGPATGSCNSNYIDEDSSYSDCHDQIWR